MARPAPDLTTPTPSADQPHRLTGQERAVFAVLHANRGRVVSRGELIRRSGLGDLSPRRCDSIIVGIRRAVGPERIVTIRRRGWMLVD